MGGRKRKTLAALKFDCQNHNYATRSKRLCLSGSSVQGSTAAAEHDMKNQVPLTCALKTSTLSSYGSKSKPDDWGKILVSCARSAVPDDLVLSILLLLPVDILHEIMKFVCRGWRHIISSPYFISNHLQISSSSALLVLNLSEPHLAFSFEPTRDADDCYRLTELAMPPFSCRIIGSCHGLVLLQDLTNLHLFHLVNLVTKSSVTLPPIRRLPLDCRGYRIALTYASSADRYKVVRVADEVPKKGYSPPPIFVCTVGVDKSWRKIDVRSIKMGRGDRNAFFNRPFSSQGIIYWITDNCFYGFALEADSEIVHKFPAFAGLRLPTCKYDKGICIALQTGFGFVIRHCDRGAGTYAWELYELTDFKSSEWTKIVFVDVVVLRSKLAKHLRPGASPLLKPLLYMRNGDIWFMAGLVNATGLYCYKTRTGNVVPFPVKNSDPMVYHHVNTLLQLKIN